MLKIAVYGKGGIGKSTTVSNISAILARKGYKVMQIGCDPKADSTVSLRHGDHIPTVIELLRKKGNAAELSEMVTEGYNGVLCVEAGGPAPGVGCAGRSIITALEALKKRNAFEKYKLDAVFYDVVGDVVCGGFAMPLRGGYADHVFILTSGENMSVYAAANIAAAVKKFDERGYARLSGVILNRRGVENEDGRVSEFVKEFDTEVIGKLDYDPVVQKAEHDVKTVVEEFPESGIAAEYEKLAEKILSICEKGKTK